MQIEKEKEYCNNEGITSISSAIALTKTKNKKQPKNDTTESNTITTKTDKNNRNLWKKPKERDRMKARYIIKDYLMNLSNSSTNNSSSTTIINDDNNNNPIEIIKPFIKAIEEGKIQYFGIHKLVTILLLPNNNNNNNMIDTPCINITNINIERMKLLSRSRFSTCYYEHLKLYLSHDNNNMTLLSYATYLGEYSIVAMLLLSLADPSSNGISTTSIGNTNANNNNNNAINSNQEYKERKIKNRIKILQTFCKSSFPLSLYCGIVRRINEMRLSGFLYMYYNNKEQEERSYCCSICNITTTIGNDDNDGITLLRYCVKTKTRIKHNNQDDEEEENCCNNLFCENCLWDDLLIHYLYRYDNDIVICPVCAKVNNDNNTNNNKDSATMNQLTHQALLFNNNDKKEEEAVSISPQEKKIQSFIKFKKLPDYSNELKNNTSNTTKKKRKNIISYNWKKSIQINQIGQSKDVRTDKFYNYIHLGSYYHIYTILQHGIDIDINSILVNEYKQTCLMIAVWYGYTTIVSLLLYYGANPYIICSSAVNNDGLVLPIDIAKRYDYRDIISLLDYYCTTYSYDATTTTTTNNITNIDDQNNNILPLLKNLKLSNKCSKTTTTSYNNQTTTKPILTYLIDPNNKDHPGKGSCIIDNILSNDVLSTIDILFQSLLSDNNSLTSDSSSNNDNNCCADRYYYCDIEGYICKLLSESIIYAFDNALPFSSKQQQQQQYDNIITKEVIVFPHVRFLNYTKQNSFLAPHVDLFRAFDLFPIQHYITTTLENEENGIVDNDHNSNENKSITYKQKYSNKSSTHSFLLYLTNCNNGGSTSLLSSLPSTTCSESDVKILAKVKPKRGRLLLFPHLCPHRGDVVIDVPKLLIRGEVYIE